ncbi:MAG: NADH-quinone oxidoreductase subunit D [Nitrospirota bacterium]|nr:NADH-quinone oxidoreductase subunit D [Nitrospirota bacterium]
MGPQHPGTHGLMRLAMELEGETVKRVVPHIGYLHTGIEKTMEGLTWRQAVTCTDRMDYLAPLSNNLAYALGVERLLGLEIPLRAQYVRVILCELTRIASHLIAVGAQAMDIGATSVFLYCFRERETIMDIFEITSGVRMMTSFITIGGLRDDIPEGFVEKARAVVDTFPAHFDDYEAMLTKNPIWLERNVGVGRLDPELGLRYAVTGPLLRCGGSKRDLRKDAPYSSYDHFEFDVPTATNSDCFDRYIVRMEEMRQSLRIIRQALDKLPGGPVKVDDRKVMAPPREELDKSMEALIHHFLLSSRGFVVPPGEVYSAIEGPRGEVAFYLVSDGGTKPYRAKLRGPSFANLQAAPLMLEGGMVADAIATIGSLDPVLGDIDR